MIVGWFVGRAASGSFGLALGGCALVIRLRGVIADLEKAF